MNPWEKPGLTVEERALAVYPEVTGSTVIGVRGCTVIVEALTAAVTEERQRCTQIMENEISAYRTAAAFGVDDIEATLSAIAARIAGEENQE